jgi:hypothetical protein
MVWFLALHLCDFYSQQDKRTVSCLRVVFKCLCFCASEFCLKPRTPAQSAGIVEWAGKQKAPRADLIQGGIIAVDIVPAFRHSCVRSKAFCLPMPMFNSGI